MVETKQIVGKGALASVAAVLLAASPAVALDLASCERVTHPSHGGEDAHRDLGGGYVMYRNWWSQEGAFHDYVVADCAAGRALSLRAHEERISDRPPFDRRPAVERRLEAFAGWDPLFYDLDRLASTLAREAKDLRVANFSDTPCACAAAYPGLSPARPYTETLQ
ncbi:MAG: hypothetical protein AAGF50_02050 [Pseudomonadota bacterium]